jgi:large subunit ribosomal protein L22
MAQHYSTSIEGARALGRDLPISMKHSVEVCRFIRGKKVILAKKMLQEVIVKERAVPYLKFTLDLGHKKGMAAGRYPVRTAEEILKIVESAEKNAQFKGMNVSKLVIAHSVAHKASEPFHGGRHRGRTMKRAHVEIILQEREVEKRVAKQHEKKKGERAP